MADFEFHINESAVEKLKSNLNLANIKTAEELMRRMKDAQVMPRNTGHMQNDATTLDASDADNGKVSVVTDTPYARRLYFNPQYNFRADNNANAQGEWWEPWISGNKKNKAKEIFAKMLKDNGGDTIA